MTVDNGAIEGRIMSMLREQLQIDVASPDTELLATGLLDSLGLVELIVMIERDFSIRVEMADLGPENFQSVERIGTFVRGLMARPQIST